MTSLLFFADMPESVPLWVPDVVATLIKILLIVNVILGLEPRIARGPLRMLIFHAKARPRMLRPSLSKTTGGTPASSRCDC